MEKKITRMFPAKDGLDMVLYLGGCVPKLQVDSVMWDGQQAWPCIFFSVHNTEKQLLLVKCDYWNKGCRPVGTVRECLVPANGADSDFSWIELACQISPPYQKNILILRCSAFFFYGIML